MNSRMFLHAMQLHLASKKGNDGADFFSHIQLCPNIVDRPSIDEVSLCCQGNVVGSVDID
jgi:hypothetical protein